jgi:hypothetical protein
MHIESLIEDAVFDNVITLSGSHGAGSKRMPGRLAVALDPLDNVLDVLGAVLEVFADGGLVGIEPGDVLLAAGLEGLGPGACEVGQWGC